VFSLDDLEHGILRSSPDDDARSFQTEDPRRSVVIPRETFDPRIHFALNCGARSCPPIKLYTEENLETALALAAQAFCESEVEVNVATKTVTMSKILFWYGKDFGKTEEEVLSKVATFLKNGSDQRTELEELIRTGEVQVKYKDYDWTQNAA